MTPPPPPLLRTAVQVKPEAHRIEAYPNVYASDYTINTRADFSDLEEAVKPYLGDWNSRTRAERTLSLIQKYANDLDTWAEDLSKHIMKVATKTVAFDPRGCRRSSKWMYDTDGHPLSPDELQSLAAKRLEAGLPAGLNESAAEAEVQLAEMYGHTHNKNILELAKEMSIDVTLPVSRADVAAQEAESKRTEKATTHKQHRHPVPATRPPRSQHRSWFSRLWGLLTGRSRRSSTEDSARE